MEELLASVRTAFEGTPRPEHFTNFMHCDECREHDETLRRHTPDTITLDEIGNPGWDPICFALPEAFQYYLPGLIRLAHEARHEYIGQLLFHLTYDRDRVERFSTQQRLAILAWLTAMDVEYGLSADESPQSDLAKLALQYLRT